MISKTIDDELLVLYHAVYTEDSLKVANKKIIQRKILIFLSKFNS